jgi:cytochrome c
MPDRIARGAAARRTAAACALAWLALASACVENSWNAGAEVVGGDPARGKAAISHYGCGSCHAVSGVPGAEGGVGPSLDGIGDRVYVAGRLTNTPSNLVAWIRHPKQIDAKTAMPELGVDEQDARDIAAYLYGR